jgi:hypothetical protein
MEVSLLLGEREGIVMRVETHVVAFDEYET